MNRAPVFLFSILVLLSLIACNRSPTEPVFPDAVLNGTVVFAESGAPAAGARIVLSGHGGADRGETLTDALGHYTLSVQGGSYSVRIYAPNSSTIALLDQLVFGTGPISANFQISGTGCALVTGRVEDGVTRAPIGGASVTFFGQHVTTSANGSFEMNLGCPPHPTSVSETIIVDHPSYQRREFLIGVPTYSTTWDITLQPR